MPYQVFDGSFAKQERQAFLGEDLEEVCSVRVNGVRAPRQNLNKSNATFLQLDEVVPVVPVKFT